MKRTTNRALSMALAIVMILSLFTVLPVSAAETTYSLVASEMTNASSVDNDANAAAPEGVPEYFTLSSNVKLYNTSADKTGKVYFNMNKDGTRTIEFTVTTGTTAEVTVQFASNGNDKAASIQLKDSTGVVAPASASNASESSTTTINSDNTVTTTGGTGRIGTVIYKNLPAGTYTFSSTSDSTYTVRLLSLVVVETSAAAEESPAASESADSGESTASTYKITVDANITGGTVTVSAATAKAGDEITVTATASTGFALDKITVTTDAGAAVAVNDGKFTMPGEDVTVSATFIASGASDTGSGDDTGDAGEANANTWTATEATVAAVVTATTGATEETKIIEMDGLDVYLGASSAVYKPVEADSEFPYSLGGGSNPDPKDGTTPTSGAYYKFVAKSDGELNVQWIVSADKPVYLLDNGSKMTGGTGDALKAKTLLNTQILAKAGHTYHVFCTGGKGMLVSVSFEPVEETVDEWVANADTVAAVVAATTGATGETKIFDGENVELWLGASSAVYKPVEADSEFPYSLGGGSNPDPKDGTTPTSGSYFKFVAKSDGELNVQWIVSADKPVYLLDNGSKMTGGTGDALKAKTLLNTQILAKAGHTYHVFCTGGKGMLVSFTFTAGGITEEEAEWTEAAILGSNPTITAKDNGNGALVATVTGPRVGVVVESGTAWTCADYMTIEMYDATGALVDSATTTDSGSTHSATFYPTSSGSYTFKAILSREDEADYSTAMSSATAFVLPIPTPTLTVGVLDGGKLNVSWPRFSEATGYNLYMADSEAGLASATAIALTTNEYTTAALTVGTTYYFQAETLRNSEKSGKSDVAKGTASDTAKVIWNYTYYGTSTTAWDEKQDKGNDTTLFDVYPDGVIGNAATPFQIRSWGGAGKVQEGDQDGVSFVYTRIPASQNFTLKATVTVEKWRYEGQEGMGLMATDALGTGNDLDKKNETNSTFVNNYMVGALRFGNGSLGATFGKAFKGNKGVGMIQEVGNPNPSVKPAAGSWDYTQINLDPYPENKGMTSGTYNILGNEVVGTDGTLGTEKAGFTQADPLVTTFTLEIERNNTGIYGRYYLPDGTVKVAKTYNRDALLQQDPDSMYVGFFAARHMVIDVQDVSLRVDDPENYPEAETPDTTYITPRVSVGSPLIANSETYNLILTSNVVGTATVTANGVTQTAELVKQKESDSSTGSTKYITRADIAVPVKSGINTVTYSFKPAPVEEQGFADYYDLLKTDTVSDSISVTYQSKFSGRNNLYVSPKGTSGGLGTKERPLDIYTAVKYAQPGQKVILMEGTYTLTSGVTIEKGISGTQDQPIYLMADPEATERIVLDGSRLSTGTGITLKGDYWHFYNFVVKNCGGSGISVNGSNNVIEYVDVVDNENTGLQIARGGEVDGVLKYWPSNNLVLNCLAWNNRDSSWGSADGFAAKLTSGTGNVFRYCIAAYNADDGWDLFAKSEDGPIGDVIIENCVVFKSGFGLDDDGNEITDPNANGNGFKMGGSGVYGNHKVYNSYSFYNKAKGVDSNSGPNTEAHNVVSYNNLGPNIRFYTDSDVANTSYAVDNWISFKSEDYKNEIYTNEGKEYNSYNVNDEIAAKGIQKRSKWSNKTAYYWTNGTTTSTSGTIADPASLFVSTDIADLEIGYNEDGNLTLIGDFLKLTDNIPANLQSVVPSTDPANYHNPENLMVMDEDLSDPYCITPDAEFVVTNNTSSGSNRGDDRSDSDTSDTARNTVNKRTNIDGDVLITVTDPTGEVLADVTLPATVPAVEKFVDVPEGHWAEAAINEMAGLGLVKGVDDVNHIYDMDSNVTRGTLATLLFRLSNGKTGLTNAFSDVADGVWYTDAISWASKVGVVNGYGDGTFGPDAAITRQELAVMLARYAALLDITTPADATMGDFTDTDAVADWAKDAVTFAVSTGIIQGTELNTINPTASATRAETAVMLQRFIALMK